MSAKVVVDGIAHQVQGAQVAVIREGRVLLQLRPWPPGWELPGGHCATGEQAADTAAREFLEETGYVVRIDGLVGVYHWSGLRSAGDAVYLATVVGGRRRPSVESPLLRELASSRLPRTTFPWVRLRVADAVAVAAGGSPRSRVQPVGMRHVLFFGMQWAAVLLDRRRGR